MVQTISRSWNQDILVKDDVSYLDELFTGLGDLLSQHQTYLDDLLSAGHYCETIFKVILSELQGRVEQVTWEQLG